MNIWICNHCHGEIPTEKTPKNCQLCGQTNRGFAKGEKKEPSKEEQEMTKKYKEVVRKLELYEEGTPPKSILEYTDHE